MRFSAAIVSRRQRLPVPVVANSRAQHDGSYEAVYYDCIVALAILYTAAGPVDI